LKSFRQATISSVYLKVSERVRSLSGVRECEYMNLRITHTQLKILQALVDIYLKTSNYVRSEDIGQVAKKTPSTVRSHLQLLKTLGLIEGVPGPKGGYKPTFKAYEFLLNHALSEKAVKIFVNGEPRNLGVERIKLTALSNSSGEKTILTVYQETALSEGDIIEIIYWKQLLIKGKILKTVGREVVIDVERLLAIPNIEVAILTHPFVLIESDMTIKDAANILSSQRIYCAIVTERGRPAGILTLKHIAKAIAEDELTCSVKEIFDPSLSVVDSSMTIWDLIQIFSGEDSEVLIVAENGKLAGVISGKEVITGLVETVLPTLFTEQHQ